jgi:hypothetical protein
MKKILSDMLSLILLKEISEEDAGFYIRIFLMLIFFFLCLLGLSLYV